MAAHSPRSPRLEDWTPEERAHHERLKKAMASRLQVADPSLPSTQARLKGSDKLRMPLVPDVSTGRGHDVEGMAPRKPVPITLRGKSTRPDVRVAR